MKLSIMLLIISACLLLLLLRSAVRRDTVGVFSCWALGSSVAYCAVQAGAAGL